MTLSMTCATCSASSMIAGAFPLRATIAVPIKIEKTTICRISLSAIAATIDVGKTWVMNCFRVRDLLAVKIGLGVGSRQGQVQSRTPAGSDEPSQDPGGERPVRAAMNQPRVLVPTRPMAAVFSIWAMPTTRVEKTRGAMIILISRRKISVTTERPSATDLMWPGSVTN